MQAAELARQVRGSTKWANKLGDFVKMKGLLLFSRQEYTHTYSAYIIPNIYVRMGKESQAIDPVTQ